MLEDDRSANGELSDTARGADGALIAVAKGLSHEPVLLSGFGVVLVLGGIGQVMGGNLLPVGWLIAGVYVISVIAWVSSRHLGAGNSAKPTAANGHGGGNRDEHPALPAAGYSAAVIIAGSPNTSVDRSANVITPRGRRRKSGDITGH